MEARKVGAGTGMNPSTALVALVHQMLESSTAKAEPLWKALNGRLRSPPRRSWEVDPAVVCIVELVAEPGVWL